MAIERRDFIKQAAGAAGMITLIGASSCASRENKQAAVTGPFSDLSSMVTDIKRITPEERLARVHQAQELMQQKNFDALYMESGSSLFYYTGIRWWPSERMMAAIVPKTGDIKYVCPAFEEERLRELILFGDDVRVWEEDESPYKVVAGIFKDIGATQTVGMEERVRFFLYDGIREAAPKITYVSADPITAAMRMIKSEHEIALMQRANDITIEAYKKTLSLMHEGMTQGEFRKNCSDAFAALGVSGGASVQFGKYSALPHGSREPQKLKEGDIVMMDGGCKVDGYSSDITRTTVLGKPTKRQTEIWNIEKVAQQKAFEAAQPGVPCENVDKAARDYLTSKGFGPGYKYLYHRTGHGIGLDGHEWTNFVLGNKTPMATGMCFSDEPGVYIKGEMGIRLEDCLYMSEEGARFFTKPSMAIDQPFG